MATLMRMKWLPLRLMLPILLISICGSVIGGFWWLERQHAFTSIEKMALSDQYQDMLRLGSQLQTALLGDSEDTISSLLQDFRSEPNLQYALIASPDGKIISATQAEWSNRMINTLGDAKLASLIKRDAENVKENVWLSKDRLTIWARHPLQLPAEAGTPHPGDYTMLIAKFNLRESKQNALGRIEGWVMVFSSLLLISLLLFWLTTRYSISQRLNRLIAAANQAKKGNFSVRAGLEGNDELAQIGSAFDAMIKQLGGETLRLQQLSQAVETMNESVLITDADGVIEYVNNAFTRISGYSAEEAIGQNPRLLKSGEHPAEFYKALWKNISQGKVWRGRVTDRRKDGSMYLATVSIAPLADADGRITHYVGVQEDISEQQKMEVQLLQAQKMESLGILVGGIAHDFNNILGGMVGNLYMARKFAKDMPEITEKLSRVEKLSFRAADMIKQLLAFARKDMVELKTLDLTPFIKEAYKLSRIAVPEDITCLSDIDAEPLYVEYDATQVQQMLMNLLGNARDALHNIAEPKITLKLSRYVPDAAFTSLHPEAESAAYAMLSIEDNGCGMSSEQVERVFEPFFTTKGVGKGSGLGLSMVFGTMQSHKGIIEVESEPGRGSTFRLFFPLSDKFSAHHAIDNTNAWQGEGERLLLADDEPIIREAISEMLEIDGFTVDVASDGLDALEKFNTQPQAYDAVILDVVMPRMGGVDAALRMRETRTDIPIIFTTGYDREHVLRGVEGIPGIVSLSKPLHSETLRQTLAELLHTDVDKAKSS